MQTIDWYFDFISPFAYLASESLDRLPENTIVRPQPILFAGLLQHHIIKGPAEIPPMRQFTFRHIRWLADQHGIDLRPPPAHPFNPLPLLRLAIAIDAGLSQVQRLFRFIWAEGMSLDDAKAWRSLLEEFEIEPEAVVTEQIKWQLRNNTEAAIANRIFGVPSFLINDEIFWGFDSLDFLIDYLANPAILQTTGMQAMDAMPNGIQRKN